MTKSLNTCPWSDPSKPRRRWRRDPRQRDPRHRDRIRRATTCYNRLAFVVWTKPYSLRPLILKGFGLRSHVRFHGDLIMRIQVVMDRRSARTDGAAYTNFLPGLQSSSRLKSLIHCEDETTKSVLKRGFDTSKASIPNGEWIRISSSSLVTRH